MNKENDVTVPPAYGDFELFGLAKSVFTESLQLVRLGHCFCELLSDEAHASPLSDRVLVFADFTTHEHLFTSPITPFDDSFLISFLNLTLLHFTFYRLFVILFLAKG